MTSTVENALLKVEARLEKTTLGPWKSDSCGDVWTEAEKEFCPGMDQNLFRTIGTTTCGPDRGDAVFIAHSRTDVPLLIAALRKAFLAVQEAQYQLGRIETAPWDEHQMRLGAKSGRFQLGRMIQEVEVLLK